MIIKEIVRLVAYGVLAGAVGAAAGNLWPFEFGSAIDAMILVAAVSMAMGVYGRLREDARSAAKRVREGVIAGAIAVIVVSLVGGNDSTVRSFGTMVALLGGAGIYSSSSRTRRSEDADKSDNERG